ncbi:MAG: hypothetical protein ABW046_18855 [Actinoplanes sp.]
MLGSSRAAATLADAPEFVRESARQGNALNAAGGLIMLSRDTGRPDEPARATDLLRGVLDETTPGNQPRLFAVAGVL